MQLFEFSRRGNRRRRLMFASLFGVVRAPLGRSSDAARPACRRSAASVRAACHSSASGSAWIAQGTATTAPQRGRCDPGRQAIATGRIRANSLRELVGDMPVETELAPDLKCLAQAVYFEARGEPIDGPAGGGRGGHQPRQVGPISGQLLRRRSPSRRSSRSFTAAISRPPTKARTRGAGPRPWRRSRSRICGRARPRDALYFHATYVRPAWARQKTELAQIDTHIFYR